MSEKKLYSFLKGYSFTFDDDGREIKAWFSVFSGKEKVFVDGNLISSKRTFSRDSSHKFSIGNDNYSTHMDAVSHFRGPLLCTLCKNGKEMKRQKLFLPTLKNNMRKRSLFYLLFYSVLFIAFAVAKAFWRFPQGAYIVFLFFLVLVAFIFLVYRIKEICSKIEIIDEEII